MDEGRGTETGSMGRDMEKEKGRTKGKISCTTAVTITVVYLVGTTYYLIRYCGYCTYVVKSGRSTFYLPVLVDCH
jgi:hypothetical protein